MKGCIKSEGIDVMCCLTEDMLADFFMTALQGSLFAKFWNIIMGGEAHHKSTLRRPSIAPAKERLEDQVMKKQDETKDRVVVSGAKGQATDVILGIARGKATYHASVLKQTAGHAYATGAVKWKNKFTNE
jgi:hypothetical protein